MITTKAKQEIITDELLRYDWSQQNTLVYPEPQPFTHVFVFGLPAFDFVLLVACACVFGAMCLQFTLEPTQ